MAGRMTAEQFALQSIFAEPYFLHEQAMSYGRTHELDPKTTFWVIRRERWFDYLQAADFMSAVDPGYSGPKTLMGLPVRITIQDDEATPMVQLVMEPMLRPKRKATAAE